MDICLELLNMALVKIENVGGMWLREKRQAKKMSQQMLADRSGACTKSFISQVENNQYPREDGSPMQPDVNTVEAWADALGESRNEARKLFGYPEVDSELSQDETLAEFTYAVGRYKQLSGESRKYFLRHANEFLDLLIHIENDNPEQTENDRGGGSGKSSTVDQTVRHAKTLDLPEISLEEATRIGKSKQSRRSKAGKGPSKDSPN